MMAGPWSSSSSSSSRANAGVAPVDLLVHGRTRRSTAGNRMKALLHQELERDDLFEEVEGDIDFQAQEEHDIVDSDFDRDSSDGQGGGRSDDDDDDEEAGERRLEEAGKAQRKAKRAKAVPVRIRKPAIRPPPPRPATRARRQDLSDHQADAERADHDEEHAGRSASKRRRISFAPSLAGPSSMREGLDTGSPGSRSLRTSSRSATVQNKLEVEEKLREAEERKAALPIRHAPKRRPQLTQDALIAEALEVEETNRESLKRFLQQEEARRAKERIRKERIEGPFIRWVSVGLRPILVANHPEKEGQEETAKKGPQSETQGEAVERPGRAEASEADPSTAQPGDTEMMEVDTAAKSPSDQLRELVAAPTRVGDPADAASQQQSTPPADQSGKVTAQHQAAETDGRSRDGTKGATSAREEEPGTPPLLPPAATSAPAPAPATSPSTPPPPARAAATPAQPPSMATPTASLPVPAASTSKLNLTEDPAVAARAEAAKLKAQQDARNRPAYTNVDPSAVDQAGPSTSTSTTSTHKLGPLQARTILSVERVPEDWTWEDDFRVLLGDHCTWSSIPVVPARNRPLRPRQSICPITGLPAIYRDPRTGIPYANAKAYKIISEVLKSRYVWTGTGAEAGDDEQDGNEKDVGGKGKRARKNDVHTSSNMVGRGAAPIEMGCYVQAEDEAGAADVFKDIDGRMTTTTTKGGDKTTLPPSQATSTAPASGSDEVDKQTTEKQSATATTTTAKPRFEMAWTPAIAPGDEEALMAAAAQLPAGSTRSGRRGARKT